MTRDELLKKLAMTNFCAVPTVQTMDMGLEFDFVDNIGAGTSFGSIGSWPLLKLEGMSSEKLTSIKDKLAAGTLEQSDIAGTDLWLLYNDCTFSRATSVAEFLVDLANVHELSEQYLWCFCDTTSGNPEARFFETKDELIGYFQENYCYDVQEWDSFDDDELEEWLGRINDKDDLGELRFCSYEDEVEDDE